MNSTSICESAWFPNYFQRIKQSITQLKNSPNSEGQPGDLDNEWSSSPCSAAATNPNGRRDLRKWSLACAAIALGTNWSLWNIHCVRHTRQDYSKFHCDASETCGWRKRDEVMKWKRQQSRNVSGLGEKTATIEVGKRRKILIWDEFE